MKRNYEVSNQEYYAWTCKVVAIERSDQTFVCLLSYNTRKNTKKH